jgi:tripartite ATP-independent transporter DctM subunit
MIPLEWMAPLMFGGLVIFMLIGYPVAFSLVAVGLFFAILCIFHEPPFFTVQYMENLPLRIFAILKNELLLAIPFFTFMGVILERCGLAEDLLEGTGQLFGPVPGGLAYAVIIVGAILGAITGTVAASVIAMGVISLPVMMRYGYNMRLATGVIAASGTITQLIPPSLVLVVLADQLGKSVGDMYFGAIGPSIAQTGLFILFIAAYSLIKPKSMPPLPPEARTLHGWALWKRVLAGMVPSLVLIFLVLGTIFMGLATPTEAGAMGAVGAIILAVLHNPHTSRLVWILAWVGAAVMVLIGLTYVFKLVNPTGPMGFLNGIGKMLDANDQPLYFVLYGSVVALLIEAARISALRGLIKQAFDSTMRITAMVVFILIGSNVFSLVFQGVDGGRWIEHMLSDLPGGVVGFLIFVNLFVFFLAFFLDFFEIAFIIVPLLAPVAQKMLAPIVGPDAALIWFGVMLCVNMQTSFMHPPFGFALFYLRGIAPKEVKSSDIYWGAIPWVFLQLALTVWVILMPSMVTLFLDTGPKVDPNTIKIETPRQPELDDLGPPKIR